MAGAALELAFFRMEEEEDDSGNQAKHWCFVWNNYPDDETIDYWIGKLNDHCTWSIYQKEIGPEKGTLHLQGAFSLKKKHKKAYLNKRCFMNKARLAVRLGSAEDCEIYCSKLEKGGSGNAVEFGVRRLLAEGARATKRARTSDLKELFQQSTFEKAYALLISEYSDVYLENYHSIMAALKHHYAPKKVVRVLPPPKKMNAFPESFKVPEAWDMFTHSLHIWGAPGIGKTIFVKQWMTAKFGVGQWAYYRGRVEALKDVCMPFIFDEINMADRPPEESRQITEVPDGGHISARYRDISIAPNTPRIFISTGPKPFKEWYSASGACSVYGCRVMQIEFV